MIWNGLRTKLTFNTHVFRESFLPAPSIFSFFRFPWAQAKGARGHSGMPKRSWEFHSASLLHKVCMFTDTVEILTRSVWNLSNLIIPPRSKSRCSYLRQNLYDHATEYWITVRETGSRTETHTEKEVRTQREKLVIISAPLPHSLPLNLKWRWQQNSPNYSGCLPTWGQWFCWSCWSKLLGWCAGHDGCQCQASQGSGWQESNRCSGTDSG